MGYQIQYAPDMSNKYVVRKARHFTAGKIAVVSITLACVIVCCTLRPVRNWLLPGDPDVTSIAADKMIESLQNGEGIQEAITTFCLEVLSNENQD